MIIFLIVVSLYFFILYAVFSLRNEWIDIPLSMAMLCGLFFEVIKLLKTNNNEFEMEKMIFENEYL